MTDQSAKALADILTRSTSDLVELGRRIAVESDSVSTPLAALFAYADHLGIDRMTLATSAQALIDYAAQEVDGRRAV